MPSSYVHLSPDERRRLIRMREAKVSVAEIAAVLGRHRSTIHREIARNWWHDAEVPQAEGYWPLTAQDLAARRRRTGCPGSSGTPRCATRWSIACARAGRPSGSPGGCASSPARHTGSATRRVSARLRPPGPERGAGPAPSKPAPPPQTPSCQEAQEPRVPGARADPAPPRAGRPPGRVRPLGSGPDDVPPRARRCERRHDRGAHDALHGGLPEQRPAIEADHGPPHRRARAPARRGAAQRDFRPRARVRLPAGVGLRPRRSGVARTTPRRRDKGPRSRTTGGRLRRHLPRDTDVLSVPDRVVRAIQDRLNATPRKCLGWRTPAEAFRDHLMEPPSPA